MNEKEPAPAGTEKSCLPPRFRKPRLRRWEAVQYLELVHGIPVAVATLAKWASIGGGPAFQSVNRTPLYPTTELDRWAAEKLGGLKRGTSQS